LSRTALFNRLNRTELDEQFLSGSGGAGKQPLALGGSGKAREISPESQVDCCLYASLDAGRFGVDISVGPTVTQELIRLLRTCSSG
jgi:hypothetical protein